MRRICLPLRDNVFCVFSVFSRVLQKTLLALHGPSQSVYISPNTRTLVCHGIKLASPRLCCLFYTIRLRCYHTRFCVVLVLRRVADMCDTHVVPSSLTHSLTYSLTHSLTLSLTLSLFCLCLVFVSETAAF
jgi:hypothetical protein